MLSLYFMRRHWNDEWLIRKVDEKGAVELKRLYIHYLDKRTDIMKKTQFKVEVVVCDVASKIDNSREQITKLNIFLAEAMYMLFLWNHSTFCIIICERKIIET